MHWLLAWVAAAVLHAGVLGGDCPASQLLGAAGQARVVPLLAGFAVGVAAWVVAMFADRLWEPLGDSTLWVVRGLFTLVTPEVVCEPASRAIGTPAFTVTIAPQCSGYEGIGLIWVFLGVYLWLDRKPGCVFPRRWLLLPLGTVFMWLANSLRVTGLILVGTWLSPAIRRAGFPFAGGLAGLQRRGPGPGRGWRRRWRYFHLDAGQGHTGRNPAAPYLVPLLVLTASMMISAAFTVGFDWFYPLADSDCRCRALVFSPRLRDACAGLGRGRPSGLGVATFLIWLLLEPAAAAGRDRRSSVVRCSK